MSQLCTAGPPRKGALDRCGYNCITANKHESGDHCDRASVLTIPSSGNCHVMIPVGSDHSAQTPNWCYSSGRELPATSQKYNAMCRQMCTVLKALSSNIGGIAGNRTANFSVGSFSDNARSTANATPCSPNKCDSVTDSPTTSIVSTCISLLISY